MEEWALLDERQRELYRDVMQENYGDAISLEPDASAQKALLLTCPSVVLTRLHADTVHGHTSTC